MKTFIQFLEGNSAIKSNLLLARQPDSDPTAATAVKDLVVVGDQILISPEGLNPND
jgi:hypothetical protein